jgi:hypothetical protein
MGIFLFILIAAAVIAIVVWSWLAEKRRREALAAIAASNGLEFSVQDPFDLPTYLAGIRAFNVGHSREASNVIHGEWRGRQVIAFDYRYTTGSGKNRTTHHLSACLQPVGLRVPNLVIRHETFFDKLAGFVGFEDINFESDEFSRRFHVQSDDRKFAYDVCNPQMMSWLLANAGSFSVELVDSSLVLTTGSQWSPDDFHNALCFSARFFELIPEFVWKGYREKSEV